MTRRPIAFEPRRLSLAVPYAIAIAILVTMITVSQLVPPDAVALDEGWSYSWDDLSPAEASARAGERPGVWTPLDYPSNPPGRTGSFLWLRRELPADGREHPHLFIFSIDTGARVYVNGELVYAWNDWSGTDVAGFAGWPPHVIGLPDGYAGGVLAIHVASAYRDIGLWGRIFLGNERTVYKSILVRDLPLIAIAVCCFAVLLVMAAIVTPRPSWSGLCLAGVVLGLAVAAVSAAFGRVVLVDDPLFWFYVETNATLFVVGLAALAVGGLVAVRSRWWATSYAVLVAAAAVVANGGSALGLFELHNFIAVVDIVAVAGIVMICVLLVARRVEPTEQRFLVVNLAIMGVVYLVELAVSYSALPWIDNVSVIIIFQFVAGLVFVFLRQYRFVVVQLAEMETTLEERIDERTRVLEEINAALAREREFYAEESRRDSLTGLYNRAYVDRFLAKLLHSGADLPSQLCVAMIDLDHFKQVNDEHGHLAGDEALRRVARTLQENLRGSEVVGRYGGEEFIIIFPGTTIDQAAAIAERIRAALERDKASSKTAVTASIGVTRYKGGDPVVLVDAADRALYAAKRAGRNRVERG